jgi:hypothetical protein
VLNQINYVNDIALKLDPSEIWKLMGYWPKIMEHIHIIDRDMDMLLTEKPQQPIIDVFLYNALPRVKTTNHNQRKSKFFSQHLTTA